MNSCYYLIDESGNSEYFLLTISTLSDYENSLQQIEEGEKMIKNSLLIGKFENFEEFHACDDDYTVRTKFVELLKIITYRSYIGIIKKTVDYNKNQGKFYYCLFYNIIRDIIIKNKGKNNIFIFEECSAIKNTIAKNNYIEIIDKINDELLNKKIIKEKIVFEVFIRGKEEKLLSISDYMGWIVLNNFIPDPKERAKNLIKSFYNLLQLKIGLIHDFDNNKFYNEKNPFKVE
jgi:hypothetical protein